MLVKNRKRPSFVSVVAVMLCLTAFAEYKDLRSIGDDEALSDWVFNASAVQFAHAITSVVSLLCAVVTAVGLWGMRSWAMVCYAGCAVVLVANEVLDALSLGFGWNEVLLRSVIAIVLLCAVGVALGHAIRKASQPDAPADV
jgi:hypothetical protein